MAPCVVFSEPPAPSLRTWAKNATSRFSELPSYGLQFCIYPPSSQHEIYRLKTNHSLWNNYCSPVSRKGFLISGFLMYSPLLARLQVLQLWKWEFPKMRAIPLLDGLEKNSKHKIYPEKFAQSNFNRAASTVKVPSRRRDCTGEIFSWAGRHWIGVRFYQCSKKVSVLFASWKTE